LKLDTEITLFLRGGDDVEAKLKEPLESLEESETSLFSVLVCSDLWVKIVLSLSVSELMFLNYSEFICLRHFTMLVGFTSISLYSRCNNSL
jgi:hypothetical protein